MAYRFAWTLLSNSLDHCSLFGYRPTYETISPLWLAACFLFWKALLLFLRGTSSGYCCLLPFVGGRVSLCEKRIFIVRHQFVTYSAVVVGHPMLIPLVMMLVFRSLQGNLLSASILQCCLPPWGHSLDFVLLSKSSPLRPGGRQPYNGAFGVGAAGPLPLPVLRCNSWSSLR